MSISPERIAAILAAARAKKAAAAPEVIKESVLPAITNTETTTSASGITYNKEQQEFINLATAGKSCILIGPAGTGKTTCMEGTVTSLIQSGKVPKLSTVGHKYLPTGTPGIIVIAFTRRAVANIRKRMPEDMKKNCITHHKLMEYQPEQTEIYDPETGKYKRSMRFMPNRSPQNPLPPEIHTVIIEESSMYSVEYFNELSACLPKTVQFILLGDIQQLPPVFGSAILGYKMLEYPTVELTQVYRQALESPIIRLAHRILSGKPIPASEYPEWKFPDQLTLHPWKKKIDASDALNTIAKFFKTAYDNNVYDPGVDAILIPFNKSCGTDELNKHIANHLARARGAMTYEIVAGFTKVYLSVGDKVLYDKEDAEVVDIKVNPTYLGATPAVASTTLDYWGFDSTIQKAAEVTDAEVDFMLQMASVDNDEERVRKASHIVKLRMNETERDIEISSASELNALLLGYALTVHKSQGSEWRKVFFVLHNSHATMVQRELLYTGVTRAKQELYVICEPETFTKGILGQRIKGNTLAEKAEFFKGKVDFKKQLS